ncbi:MAG: hypothetical protein EA385_12700 [Salinarimonadaceae bacterium]|nr:MAG: hypothetical protein EA385_12700 [Salinarimonadaceae bacterium]
MDLVRTEDRRVARDQGDGRGGGRRDGQEQEKQPATPRADEAARRARQQTQQQQPVALVRDPRDQRDPARETAVLRETGAPGARRTSERSGGERSQVARGGQEPQGGTRRSGATDIDAPRVVERRVTPPPMPVGEREIDRRSSPDSLVAGSARGPAEVARRPLTAPPALAPRGGRGEAAASLVMPTAGADSLGLIASTIGLALSPYRLNSQTPPEIARRIAHFMRTGELDRSPVRFTPQSAVAAPNADEKPGAQTDAPQPRLLPPFAQSTGGQAPSAPLPNIPSLFGPHFEQQLHPDRRKKSPPIPMQAAVLAATAMTPQSPHVGTESETVNPFFDDYEMKSLERRKQDAHAVAESFRRREEDSTAA